MQSSHSIKSGESASGLRKLLANKVNRFLLLFKLLYFVVVLFFQPLVHRVKSGFSRNNGPLQKTSLRRFAAMQSQKTNTTPQMGKLHLSLYEMQVTLHEGAVLAMEIKELVQ